MNNQSRMIHRGALRLTGAVLCLAGCALGTNQPSPGPSTAPPQHGETTSPALVVVPDIEGKLCLKADELLLQAGLVPADTPVHGPIEHDAAGFASAYRQNPRPGTKVPKGSTVSYRWWWEAS